MPLGDHAIRGFRKQDIGKPAPPTIQLELGEVVEHGGGEVVHARHRVADGCAPERVL